MSNQAFANRSRSSPAATVGSPVRTVSWLRSAVNPIGRSQDGELVDQGYVSVQTHLLGDLFHHDFSKHV